MVAGMRKCSDKKMPANRCGGCGHIVVGRNKAGQVVRKYPAGWAISCSVCPHEECDASGRKLPAAEATEL